MTTENAAPSTALPLGESRIISPTRLTRVDPSGPAHITRLLNTVLAVVHLSPEDRIKKDGQVKVKDEPAPESEGVKAEEPSAGEGDGGVAAEEEGEEEDMDEDEVPYREEVGWKEITGFIVM